VKNSTTTTCTIHTWAASSKSENCTFFFALLMEISLSERLSLVSAGLDQAAEVEEACLSRFEKLSLVSTAGLDKAEVEDAGPPLSLVSKFGLDQTKVEEEALSVEVGMPELSSDVEDAIARS
jgi:hypothetical protein